jgi:hypothetical protein
MKELLAPSVFDQQMGGLRLFRRFLALEGPKYPVRRKRAPGGPDQAGQVIGIGYLADYHFGLPGVTGRTIAPHRLADFTRRNRIIRSVSYALLSWGGEGACINTVHQHFVPRCALMHSFEGATTWPTSEPSPARTA